MFDIRKCGHIYSNFRQNNDGNFGLIASLMSMSLIAGAGLAIDKSDFDSSLTKAQIALDSAALAAADEDISKGMSDVNKTVKAFLDSNFSENSAVSIYGVNSNINSEGYLSVKAKVDVKPKFGNIFGYDSYTGSVESVVNLPQSFPYERVNIAIVWDVSTSMTSLLPDVKSAVNSLNAEFQTNEFEGEFSLFPYSQYDSNRNEGFYSQELDFIMDKDLIQSSIDDMAIMASTPAHTNGGAACAWEALDQANQTIETVFSDDLNVIFFMHDGDGYCGADDKIVEQCQIIRDRGIEMISVRFGSWSTKEQLFLDCVDGNTDKYFYVDSAESALSAFFGGTFGGDFEKYIVK